MAGRMVSADEAQQIADAHHEEIGPRDDMWSRCAAGCQEWNWQDLCEPYNLAHTVVELTAQLDAANARADAAEAKVRAVEALATEWCDGLTGAIGEGIASTMTNELLDALATPEVQS